MQYERPAIDDLGSIADHTFLHTLGVPISPFDLLNGLGSAPS